MNKRYYSDNYLDRNVTTVWKHLIREYDFCADKIDLRRILLNLHFKYATNNHSRTINLSKKQYCDITYEKVCADTIRMLPPSPEMYESDDQSDKEFVKLFIKRRNKYSEWNKIDFEDVKKMKN